MKNPEENYYIRNRTKLLKDFDRFFKFARIPLSDYFSDDKMQEIKTAACRDFEKQIPAIPYIGGKKNSGTANLTGSIILLTVVRAIEPTGMELREIGHIVYRTFEEYAASFPRIIMKLSGYMMRTRLFLRIGKKRAVLSQERTWPGDFVNRFIVGDGIEYDCAQLTEECAICKYFKTQDAEKYIPYFCLGDYPIFRALGIGLYRTETIGNGGKVCDFRFKLDGSTQSGWPPEELPEWNG